MTATDDLLRLGEDLFDRSGPAPAEIYDLRIDHDSLGTRTTPQQHRHVAHQALMRCYQGRFVLLPGNAAQGSILEALDARYDPVATLRLDAHRAALEADLLGAQVSAARQAATGQDCATYIPAMLESIRTAPSSSFLDWLHDHPAPRAPLPQLPDPVLRRPSRRSIGLGPGGHRRIRTAAIRLVPDSDRRVRLWHP